MTRGLVFALVIAAASSAWAQAPSAPPAPPAAPAAQPPAPAVQPQPYPYPYPQPYPYAYPQYPYPYWQAPRPLPAEMAYDPEKPIPPGYKIEERVRKGAVISGAIIGGVPYVLGLNIAAASGFDNKSYWLVVPGVGPFLTLATRHDDCDERDADGDRPLACLGDVFLSMLLVLDGLMQTGGGVALTVGLTAKKKVLVREQAAVRIAPMRVGRAHGLGVVGSF
jgi:hypothetical protein